MSIMTIVFYHINKFSYNETVDLTNTVGSKGDVYLTIPANNKGVGKVQINLQGQLKTLNAKTTDAEDIKMGAVIEVIDVENKDTLIVHKLK